MDGRFNHFLTHAKHREGDDRFCEYEFQRAQSSKSTFWSRCLTRYLRELREASRQITGWWFGCHQFLICPEINWVANHIFIFPYILVDVYIYILGMSNHPVIDDSSIIFQRGGWTTKQVKPKVMPMERPRGTQPYIQTMHQQKCIWKHHKTSIKHKWHIC